MRRIDWYQFHPIPTIRRRENQEKPKTPQAPRGKSAITFSPDEVHRFPQRFSKDKASRKILVWLPSKSVANSSWAGKNRAADRYIYIYILVASVLAALAPRRGTTQRIHEAVGVRGWWWGTREGSFRSLVHLQGSETNLMMQTMSVTVQCKRNTS